MRASANTLAASFLMAVGRSACCAMCGWHLDSSIQGFLLCRRRNLEMGIPKNAATYMDAEPKIHEIKDHTLRPF